MTQNSLAKRLSKLEQEVASLRQQVEARGSGSNRWVERFAGIFANDPAYAEASRLGRKYRALVDAKGNKRKPNANGHT